MSKGSTMMSKVMLTLLEENATMSMGARIRSMEKKITLKVQRIKSLEKETLCKEQEILSCEVAKILEFYRFFHERVLKLYLKKFLSKLIYEIVLIKKISFPYE